MALRCCCGRCILAGLHPGQRALLGPVLSCAVWWAWGLSRPAETLGGLGGMRGRWSRDWEEVLRRNNKGALEEVEAYFDH